jgi:hypothetical protein
MVPPAVWTHYIAPSERALSMCFTCWTAIVEARDGGRYQAEHGRSALLPDFIPIPRRGVEALTKMSPGERKAFYRSTFKDPGFRWLLDPELVEHVTRRREQERQERADGPRWWWLSFATAEQFLGVAVVEAVTFEDAIRAARARGCNPGGEVQAQRLPGDHRIGPEYRNRLLSASDIDAMRQSWGEDANSMGDVDIQDDTDDDVDTESSPGPDAPPPSGRPGRDGEETMKP